MEKREKNKNIIVLGIVMAISLSVALNIGNIFGGIGTFFKILNPIILGCMLAVIFNVPMEALSRQLERLSKKVKFLKKEKARNGISLVVTIVIVVLVFAVIMWSIIPDLIESITGFIKNFDNNVNVVTDILDKYDEHLTFINDYVEKIDWNSILKKSGEVAGAFFQSIFTGIPQIGSSLFNLSISVIIAVYVLMDKRRLLSQTERLLEAVFGKKVSSKVTGVTNLFAQTYASFLTGQCVEACILAVLMFITLSICRMPYAGLISIMAVPVRSIHRNIFSVCCWCISCAIHQSGTYYMVCNRISDCSVYRGTVHISKGCRKLCRTSGTLYINGGVLRRQVLRPSRDDILYSAHIGYIPAP